MGSDTSVVCPDALITLCSAGSSNMLQNLPGELLQCIAGHLSNTEWARARGCCRSFSQVQLRQICLLPESMAALRWCTKVWQEAVSIDLDVGHLDLGSSELSQVLERGQGNMFYPGIVELCIRGLETADTGDEDMVWLEMILSKACAVQKLVLHTGTISSLPTFSHLRHLVLYAQDEIRSQACLAIGNLESLETISICGFFETTETIIPALDLRGCRNLKAAHFNEAAPEELLGAPEGCWLIMECRYETIMQRWEKYSQVCTGVRMEWVTQPPAILSVPCPFLTCLEIYSNGNRIDDRISIVISGPMPTLRLLDIQCLDLSLRIESSLRLHRLKIKARNIDELLVRDVSALTVQMNTLIVEGTVRSVVPMVHFCIEELLAAFAVKKRSRGTSEVVTWRHVEPVHAMLSKDVEQLECMCGGACFKCLRRSGIFDFAKGPYE